MDWRLPKGLGTVDGLRPHIERYRVQYLSYFLDRFRGAHRSDYRGGYFNINSVTGEPYDHRLCYSWTDGRSLGELSASLVAVIV